MFDVLLALKPSVMLIESSLSIEGVQLGGSLKTLVSRTNLYGVVGAWSKKMMLLQKMTFLKRGFSLNNGSEYIHGSRVHNFENLFAQQLLVLSLLHGNCLYQVQR